MLCDAKCIIVLCCAIQVTNMFSGGSLVVPWVFITSGLLGGLVLTALAMGACCYTACVIIKEAQHLKCNDLNFVFGFRLGKWAKSLSLGSTLFLFLFVLCAYQSFVVSVLVTIFPSYLGNSSATLVFLVICYPISAYPNVINRLASFGVFWILWVSIFLICQVPPQSHVPPHTPIVCTTSHCNRMYHLTLQSGLQSSQQLMTAGATLKLMGSEALGSAPGVLVAIFACHTYVLVMLAQKRDPKTSIRDVCIAFAIVGVLVCINGSLASLAFSDPSSPPPPQNFVIAFSGGYAVSAMVATTFAMIGDERWCLL
jgi:hypothetical protein